jgi:3-hydroxyisobutyrate dehydrogenase-like beta-hydroxyacid dehydrogenase
VALLGLGEAGAALAADLVASGADVRGWDPAPGRLVPGVTPATGEADAVAGAAVVLSVTTAAAALDAARAAAGALSPDALYADLNTSAAALKRELARVVEGTGAAFADVALVAPVPGRGLRTPTLASGGGAERYRDTFAPMGQPVEVVGPEPGAAAARKLVRSVFVKGIAAAVMESLAAAAALGCGEWLREDVVATLADADRTFVERLEHGSRVHAVRRVAEMEAAAEQLRSLGIEPRIATAAAEALRELT